MKPSARIPATVAVLFVLVILQTISGAALAQQSREGASRKGGSELEIPPILYTSLTTQDRTYPTWVSAEAAVDADGNLTEELFHPHAVRALEDLLTTSPREDGCLQLGNVYESIVNPPDRSSLAKATRGSDLVLLATVVSREYGFHFSEAGQLIAVRVDEVLRGEAERGEYFLFLPVGHFEAGPYSICKTDSRYAAPPDIGDEVVLLLPEVENPSEPYLDLVWGTSLVVIEESGRVRVPRAFELEKPIASRNGLIERIRRAGSGR